MRVVFGQNKKEISKDTKDTILIRNLKITFNGFYVKGKNFFSLSNPCKTVPVNCQS